MANPPIVIGSFANVPAPGSPIKSDWPQEISTFVTALPYGYIGHAYGPAVNQNVTNGTNIAGMSVAFNAVAGRSYLTILNMSVNANASPAIYEAFIVSPGGVVASQICHVSTSGYYGALTAFEIYTPGATAATTRAARLDVSAGVPTIAGSGWGKALLLVLDVGAPRPALLDALLDRFAGDAESKPGVEGEPEATPS